MTTRKTTEKADEKDDAADDSGDKKDDAGATDGGGSSDSDGLEGRIRTLVKEAVDSLLGDSSKATGRASVADSEEELERRVRAAHEKLTAEEKKEGRVTKLEEKLEKVLEKPPARDGIGGKVSRFLWGSED